MEQGLTYLDHYQSLMTEFYNQCHEQSGTNGGQFCETDTGNLEQQLAPALKHTLGIPRADMPQFSGVPIKGSKASKLKAKDNGEVDARSQFRDFLHERGIKTSEKKIEAHTLNPTQNQLDYDKVARYIKDHKEDEQLVVVSSDGYILDGTHHWAANYIKDSKVRAIVVDAPIKKLLPIGHEFDEEWGLTGKTLNASALSVYLEQFMNSCHDPDTGEFCEGDAPRKGRGPDRTKRKAGSGGANKRAPRPITIDGDIAYIPLSDTDPTIRTMIDASDVPLVKDHYWAFGRNGYVQTRIDGKGVSLHQFLLGRADDRWDHKNQNILDNRRENLRPSTASKNAANAGNPINNTSGYKGVSFDKARGKYLAYIKINYKRYNLGRFGTAQEAAEAYNKAAQAAWGEHASLNEITPPSLNASGGNPCHSPADGKFCETAGHNHDIPADVQAETKGYSEEERQAYYKEYRDNAKLDAWVKKNGPEMPPKLGGPLWAFEGESSEITRAADEQLSNSERDPGYSPGKNEWDVATTILNTLHTENKRNDEPLYSGHHRGKQEMEDQIKEGAVFFPLVATSPDRKLAEVYAGEGTASVAVIYHFPKGSAVSQPYQQNETIATGVYTITGHKWTDDRHVQVDLKYDWDGKETSAN